MGRKMASALFPLGRRAMDYIAKIMQLALAHLMRRPGSVLCPIASPQAGELAKARRGAQFVRIAVGVGAQKA